MSTTIDERVVEMKFDNSDFEKNVGITQNTLERLKKSLNMEGVSEGIDDVSASLGGLDLSPLASAASNLQGHFSALETMATGALLKIGAQAVETGEKLIKSLTIDQITEGWGKYEEKTNSVKTIMSATGLSVDEVNDRLDKLNWFTDETSYSFLEMASSVGKFTSNSVDLDTSIAAMQGIANWAGLSGASTEEASRAMYNLSQAIGVGAVKLQDWKSIENANMATAGFKEQAIETAVALGTLTEVSEGVFETVKGNEVTVQNFNENLSDGWFSADVLTTVLGKYGEFSDVLYDLSDDFDTASQSMEAWNEAAGDMDAMKDLFKDTDTFKQKLIDAALAAGTLTESTDGIITTNDGAVVSLEELDDVLSESWVTDGMVTDALQELSDMTSSIGAEAFLAAQEAKSFTDVINSVKDAVSTGWMNTFENIFGNYEDARHLWTDMANDMWTLFAGGGEFRNDALEYWRDELGGYDDIKNAYASLADGILSIQEALQNAWRTGLFGSDDYDEQVAGYASAFKSLTGALSKGLEIISNVIHILLDNGVSDMLTGIFSAIGLIKTVLGGVIKLVSKLAGGNGGGLLSTLVKVILFIPAAIGRAITSFNNWLNSSDAITKAIGFVVGKVRHFKMIIENQLSGVFAVIDGVKAQINEFLQSEKFLAFKDDVVYVFDTIKEAVTTFFNTLFGFQDETDPKEFLASMQNVPEWATDAIGKFQDIISKVEEKLGPFSEIAEKAATAIEGFGDKATTVAGNLKTSVGDKIAAISEKFQALKDKIVGIKDKIVGFFKSFQTGERTLPTFSEILEGIKNVISKVVEWIIKAKDAIADFIEEHGGIKMILADLAALFAEGGILYAIIQYGSLLGGLNKSQASLTETLKGLGGSAAKALGSLSDALSGLTKKMNSDDTIAKLKAIAVCVLAIAVAMFILAQCDPVQIGVSLGAVTAAIGELLATMKIMNGLGESKTDFSAINKVLIAMGVAILLIAVAMRTLKDMDPVTMAVSAAALSATLVALIAALKIMSSKEMKSTIDWKQIIALGISLYIVAKAIKKIGDVVVELGQYDAKTLAKGLGSVIAIISALAVFAIAIQKFNANNSMKDLAQSLVLVAVALILMMIPIKTLGNMDPAKLEQGFGALAGLIAIIAVFAMAVNKTGIDENITKLGTSMVLLAVAINMLVIPILILGLLPTAVLLKGALTIVAFIAALTAMSVVISKFGGEGEVLKMAASMAIVAAAINMLIIPIMILGNMKLGTLAKGLISIIALMAAMTAMMVILSKMTDNETQFVKAAAAILIMAVALNLIVLPLKILGTMSLQAVGIALIALAGAFLILGAAGIVLSAIGTPLLIAGAAIALIGAGSLMCAAAILMLLKAFILLGASGAALAAGILALGTALIASLPTLLNMFLKTLSDMIVDTLYVVVSFVGQFLAMFTQLLDTLLEYAPGIFEKVFTLIGEFLAALAEHLPSWVESIVSMARTIIQGLGEIIPDLVELGMTLLLSLLHGISEHIGDIVNTAFDIITTFLDTLSQRIPEVIEKGVEVILSFINGLANAIDEHSDEATEAVGNLVTSIGEAALKFFEELIPKVVEIGGEIIEGLKQGISDTWEKIKSGIAGIGEKVIDVFKKTFGINSPSKEFAEIGEYNMEGLAKGTEDGYDDNKGFFEGLGDKILEFFGGKGNDAEQEGRDLVNSFKSGMNSSSGMGSALTSSVSTALSNVSGMNTLFKSTGNDMMDSMSKGITKRSSVVRNAATSVATQANKGVRNYYTSFESTGKYLMEGLQSGINKKAQQVVKAAGNVATNAIKRVQYITDVQSPSRVFAKIGEYWDLGLVKGVERFGKRVSDATGEVGEDAIQSMQSEISRLSSMIDDNLDTNPVIRPVLDLSDIQNGSGLLGDMLGETTYGLAGSISRTRESASIVSMLKEAIAEAKPEATFNNTFNITVPEEAANRMSMREMATYISKEINFQLTREVAAWR